MVHLVVTVGHTAPSGDSLLRTDLLARGLHLARLLAGLLPDEPEVTGLLALVLLHAGRRDARTDEAGLPVLLDGQDDGRWDAAVVDEGRAAAAEALARAPRRAGSRCRRRSPRRTCGGRRRTGRRSYGCTPGCWRSGTAPSWP